LKAAYELSINESLFRYQDNDTIKTVLVMRQLVDLTDAQVAAELTAVGKKNPVLANVLGDIETYEFMKTCMIVCETHYGRGTDHVYSTGWLKTNLHGVHGAVRIQSFLYIYIFDHPCQFLRYVVMDLIKIMLGILDGHAFEFDRELYQKYREKPGQKEKLDVFNNRRWTSLKEIPEYKARIVTAELLDGIDQIYKEEFLEIDGISMDFLIGTTHPAWTDAMEEYNRRVRKMLLGYGNEKDQTLIDKLDWVFSTEDRGRPLLPLPTKSVIKALTDAYGATPEALKEVSDYYSDQSDESIAIIMRRDYHAQHVAMIVFDTPHTLCDETITLSMSL
jgi:hypothetical protein